MKLSQFTHAVIAGSLITAGTLAHAEISTSGALALSSDYLFRGISQSAEHMAVQGSFTAAHDSGAYFTAWGSSISAEATLEPQAAGIELDTVLGYSGTSAAGMAYDVGVMRYNYPGADNQPTTNTAFSYNEVFGSVSLAGAKVGVAYSNDYFAETGKFLYVYSDYSHELMENLKGSVHLGWNKFENDGKNKFLAAAGDSDAYFDYKLALSTELKGIGFELAYSGADAIAEAAYGEGADGRFVVSASKVF